MTLSIIIPVFNSGEYLSGCLESILSQSFSDFEILLVDDGSNDGSGSQCDEYVGKDNRIRVFHKRNGGVCSARNRGIDNARGEFIVFVDADDYVTDVYLEHLMESDADMVVTGVQKFGAKEETIMPACREDYGIGDLAAHWNRPFEMNFQYCYPVAKRYRTEILRKHEIRFDESLFYSEDLCFNMRYSAYADSFTELPYADYFYRIMGITRDEKYRMSAEQLTAHHESLEACISRLYERIGAGTLSSVRDNTNLRLIRKFYSFLMQEGMGPRDFVGNVKEFRKKSWAGYMMGLLEGKRQKRVMREAVRFPLLTYWIEIRLRNAIACFSHH